MGEFSQKINKNPCLLENLKEKVYLRELDFSGNIAISKLFSKAKVASRNEFEG